MIETAVLLSPVVTWCTAGNAAKELFSAQPAMWGLKIGLGHTWFRCYKIRLPMLIQHSADENRGERRHSRNGDSRRERDAHLVQVPVSDYDAH